MKFHRGNIFSIDFTTQDELLAWIDKEVENSESTFKLISRLPPRRLLEHVDLSKIQLLWLSERKSNYSLPPNLDKIRSHLMPLADGNEQITILDGFEWLVNMHGSEVILNFIHDLSDSLQGTRARLIIPINTLAFETTWLARLRKEVIHVKIINEKSEIDSFIETEEEILTEQLSPSERIEYELGVDGSQRLTILSRLPSIGFTRKILVKRILQWRRMGLDVSELEPGLNYDSERSYELYSRVEEKIRRVVELENYLYHHIDSIGTTELATALFRIKQLTGIDELEKKYYS